MDFLNLPTKKDVWTKLADRAMSDLGFPPEKVYEVFSILNELPVLHGLDMRFKDLTQNMRRPGIEISAFYSGERKILVGAPNEMVRQFFEDLAPGRGLEFDEFSRPAQLKDPREYSAQMVSPVKGINLIIRQPITGTTTCF